MTGNDPYAFPPPPLTDETSGYPYPPDPSQSLAPTTVLNLPTTPPELLIPSEPQIFTMEDSIVMILKPREFLKKKIEIMNAGSNFLQVFSDFEHVFTKFRSSEDATRSFSTAEILESSTALLPQAIASLRTTAEKYENTDMDEHLFEEYTNSCHNIIANEGGLHINSIPPLTRDYLEKLNLRNGKLHQTNGRLYAY